MSANNELRIEEHKEGWEVCDVDVDSGSSYYVQKPVKTLEEAIKVANEYQATHEVEYGLQIVLENT